MSNTGSRSTTGTGLSVAGRQQPDGGAARISRSNRAPGGAKVRAQKTRSIGQGAAHPGAIIAANDVTRKRTQSGIEYEVGTDNIFADLDLPNADELLLKAQMAIRIRQLIEAKHLTQGEVARLIQLDQPKVSKLMRGRLDDFSVDRLLVVLQRLGHKVEIRIAPKAVAPEQAHAVVRVG
jgi:predicted XRE-type DNA-binding protein